MDPAGDQKYGGLHLRFAAGLTDLLLSQALFFVVLVVIGVWSRLVDVPLTAKPSAAWLDFGLMWLYFAAFESSARRATPGKLLFRLAVVDYQGHRLSFWRASARFLLKLISASTVVGVLVIPFNRRRRGLHDVFAGTLVVERSPPAPEPPIVSTPSSNSPPAAGPIRRRSRGRVAIASVILVVFLAIVLWQVGAWDEDRRTQPACLASLQEDRQKGQAAQRKWDQFREEIARLEAELAQLKQMLPSRLDVAGFREALDRDLMEHSLSARILSTRTFRRGKLFRAELRMEVIGDSEDIAGVLGQRGCCAGRLTRWEGSFQTDGVTGTLSIYATPEPAAPLPACLSPRSDLWLWPLSITSARLAREIARARAELRPLTHAAAEVRRYETRKMDLENRVQFINRLLRPESRPFGHEEEPEVPIEETPRGLLS